MIKRPPIVTIMGHVDHGKTTLLDYIRKTNLAEREAGGITQAIGAYEIEHANNAPPPGGSGNANAPMRIAEKITFIDTPGHEAFSRMRAYGAHVADIAILVVAADDGVKPQTKNALEHIKASKTPFLVAINKIDKPNADIERVKADLAKVGVLLEGYGGNVSWQAISAKTGEGVSELLDLIILAADLENLTYNPDNPASGFVITSYLDPKVGIMAGLIIEDGSLRTGDFVATETAGGKVKSIENFRGEKTPKIEPSSPALIMGFESLPRVGEFFAAGADETAAREALRRQERQAMTSAGSPAETAAQTGGKNIILKARESASLEALEGLILKLKKDLPRLNVVSSSVGNVGENDIKTAESAGATVVGFGVKTDKTAQSLATARNIPIVLSNIIYELEKKVRETAKEAEEDEKGILEVLATFSKTGKKQLVGGKVALGLIRNKESFEVEENGETIGKGKILNLQSRKKNVAEVVSGEEAGLMVQCDVEIKTGHKLLFN